MARRTLRILAATFATALLLAGCGHNSTSVATHRTPQQVLDLTVQTLAQTSGVHLTLAGTLPPGVTGLTGADGVATRAPAFDGTLSVVLAGSKFIVPVKAVDGKVYAQIPLTPGWSQVNASDYQAPDPANLISAASGIPAVVKATSGLQQGKDARGGQDNKEILTTYTGTVPGSTMKEFLPSASGDTFRATYQVAGNGQLRSAILTGVFYAGTPSMTYTLTLDDYGTTTTVTAPPLAS